MAREIESLRYLVEVVWTGDKDTARAKRAIDDLGDAGPKAAKKSTSSFASIGTAAGVAAGAIGVAAMAAKVGWQQFEQGAELQLAAQRFDNLTASIGTTSDALTNDLRAATKGMVSDGELIASASQIISLGLGKTGEDVTRLATLVSGLGWDMQTVIMTFANDSKMRLDALGLSVEDVEKKMKALEEQGYRTDQAFDMAVMEAGEEKMLLFGDASETAAGQIAIARAEWNTFVQDLQAGWAGVVGPILGAINDWRAAPPNPLILPQAVGTGRGFEAWLAGTVAAGQYVPGDYQTQQAWFRDAQIAQRGVYQMASRDANVRTRPGIATSSMFDYGALPAPNGNLRIQTAAEIEADRQRQIGARIMADYSRRGLETAAAIEAQTAALTGGYGGGGLVGGLDQAAAAMANLASESGSLFASLRGDKEFDLGEELFDLAARKGMSALRLSELGVAAGLFDQGRANELLNRTFLLQSAEQLLSGNPAIGGADLWGAVQGLQGSLGDDAGLAREFFGNVDAAVALTVDTAPANDAYMAWAALIERNPPVIRPVIDLANAEIRGPGGVVINNYGGAAVATQMALITARRSQPQDQLLGRGPQ